MTGPTRSCQEQRRALPEWITNNKECDVNFVSVLHDFLAAGLDHFSVGDDDGTAIVSFLLLAQRRYLVSVTLCAGSWYITGETHKLFLVDQQDSCVSLEIDALGFAHDFKAFDGDVFLVGQTEADYVQHPVYLLYTLFGVEVKCSGLLQRRN